MEIEDLKAECNFLIDEIEELQKTEDSLDLRIQALRQELNFLRNPPAIGAGECEALEIQENQEQSGAKPMHPKLGPPLFPNDITEETKQEPPKTVLIRDQKEERATAEERGQASALVSNIANGEALEEEPSALEEQEEESAEENPAEGQDKESQEAFLSTRDAPGLGKDEEDRLANQMRLLSGKEGRELVIVYEKSAGLQKAEDLIKAGCMIIFMLAIVAAIVLFLYYQMAA